MAIDYTQPKNDTGSAAALKFVSELTTKAGSIQLQNLPNRKTLVYVNGETTILEPIAPKIDDELADLESLKTWVAKYAPEDPANDVEIFVGAESIEAFVKRAEPEPKRAALSLNKHPAYLALIAWIDTPHSQKSAVRKLRGVLSGTCPGVVLTALRSIEFKTTGSTSATVYKQSDTLGKSISREAKFGDAELPDEIVFRLPVFDYHGAEEITIPCAVEIDYDAAAVGLLPLGNSIANAVDLSRRALRSILIADTKATVYLGDNNT